MRRIRRHLSFANVVSVIALFVAISGGTAVALGGANTVFTDDIADDTRPASGGNPPGGLVAADLRPNSVGSSEVANGSIASGDLAPVARGARAYGRVAADGTLTRSKNVTSVTKPFTGVYCITLAASIDPASAVLVVGPDYSSNGTSTASDNASVVEWDAAAPNCASQLQVRTFFYNGDPLDNNDGTGDTAGGDILTEDDESFAFVVP